MSREIQNLSIGQLVKYHPENFKDSRDAQIEMGEAAPFKDDPIEEVRTIDDRLPACERWGFTSRYYVHACSDSPEVQKIKIIISNRQSKRHGK